MFNLLFVKADFLKSLEILWKGMLAMLIVIGVIIAVTYVVLYVSKRFADRAARAERENGANPIDNNNSEENKG